MRAGCLVIFLASLMVGLVHCAPEGAREEIVNDYEDSTQQDEPMYDDDGNEDDDDGGDDDENGDEEEYDVMERRSADVEFDNPYPSDVSDKVDTLIKPINGITDGKTDSCTNKPLRSKCGRPHLPKHGGVRLNGQYLSYYCHKGYSLHGAKSNRCVRTYRKHRWIHNAPKCKCSRSHRY